MKEAHIAVHEGLLRLARTLVIPTLIVKKTTLSSPVFLRFPRHFLIGRLSAVNRQQDLGSSVGEGSIGFGPFLLDLAARLQVADQHTAEKTMTGVGWWLL